MRPNQISDATLHEDNDTPKASDADIKRCDADTVVGLGDSKNQGIGYSPTDVRKPANIQNAPKTLS
jgi:hypothetical protein